MDTTRRIEKRNRPPLSCEPCRARKSKCNRATPCDSCTKRNQPSACHYAANVRRTDSSSNSKKSSSASNIADRLKDLEALVSSLASQGLVVQQGPGPVQPPAPLAVATDGAQESKPAIPVHDPGQNGVEPETPRLRQSQDGQVHFLDSSHWLSILEDIREVREHLSPEGMLVHHEEEGSSKGSDEGMGGMASMTGLTGMGGLLPEPDNPELTSVLGLEVKPDLDEILASVPPRGVCDKLISHYFNSRFGILAIIHPFEFQKDYEAFWAAPSKTNPIWIALLFAVLTVATNLFRLSRAHEANHPSTAATLPESQLLERRTVECLILGRFATAHAHALEAFVLHLQSRFLHAGRNSASTALIHIWFEAGTIIRLAFRMGYHRDPAIVGPQDPAGPGRGRPFSPYQIEMRRRVWTNIFQVDALMSFQMGFPSMIPTECCDTRPPRNLDYADFNSSSPVLPPGRPLDADTPIVYAVAKASVMAVFKKIAAHTQSLIRPDLDPSSSYQYRERTRELTRQARAAYAAVPDQLQRRDVARCTMDTPARIVERTNIELLHLKSLVVLNRRFVSYSLHSSSSSSSVPVEPELERYTNGGKAQNGNGTDTVPCETDFRRTCVEAALGILARQADLAAAAQPGGRLYEDKWMLASLMQHDFLLAAMVLCLDLSVRLSSTSATVAAASHGITAMNIADKDIYHTTNQDEEDLDDRICRALQTSRSVWSASSMASPEAKTATFTLDLMLKKVAEKRRQREERYAAAVAAAAAAAAEPVFPGQGLPYAEMMSSVIDGSMIPDWNPNMEMPEMAAFQGEPGFPSHVLEL
ncbi:uncharacterized protein C8A04DRAFT_40204 [Dichotomopilus funicola]|uniref:Zn(2)-C6 fungal-type domain-containing protein n=1 Tax=Dichotomopilus funicola TaxID=1934379 RepID=A0AAN6UVR4_9PEZI|nr:hypothetical protein C8A04DRAFT_40204 [Dichotomopilus funicola]